MIPLTAHSQFDFTVINICSLSWDLYSASLQHQKHLHLAVETHAISVANCSVWQVRFSRSLSDGQTEWPLWSTLASFSDSHTTRFNCVQYSSIGAVAVVGALITTEDPTYKLPTCITKGIQIFHYIFHTFSEITGWPCTAVCLMCVPFFSADNGYSYFCSKRVTAKCVRCPGSRGSCGHNKRSMMAYLWQLHYTTICAWIRIALFRDLLIRDVQNSYSDYCPPYNHYYCDHHHVFLQTYTTCWFVGWIHTL